MRFWNNTEIGRWVMVMLQYISVRYEYSAYESVGKIDREGGYYLFGVWSRLSLYGIPLYILSGGIIARITKAFAMCLPSYSVYTYTQLPTPSVVVIVVVVILTGWSFYKYCVLCFYAPLPRYITDQDGPALIGDVSFLSFIDTIDVLSYHFYIYTLFTSNI